jgi:bifunctional non-homologous end joining protein LigD
VKRVKAPPTSPGWLHEIKFDGYPLQARIEAGQARFYTRNGVDWTDRFPMLATAATELPDAVLDGELCARRASGYSDFSALRSALARRQTDNLVLFVFDALFAEGDDLRALPLTDRKARLRALLDAGGEIAQSRFKWVDEFDAPAAELLQAACEVGFEGIVSKRRTAPYRSGRGDTWVKSKCRPSEKVVIGGWRTEGSSFHSLIAGVWDEGRLRYAGSIHGGYSGSAVAELVQVLTPLQTAQHAFEIGDIPKKTRDIHWTRPELVAEIEFAEFTASGKLRQATYKGLRPDKSPADLKDDDEPS